MQSARWGSIIHTKSTTGSNSNVESIGIRTAGRCPEYIIFANSGSRVYPEFQRCVGESIEWEGIIESCRIASPKAQAEEIGCTGLRDWADGDRAVILWPSRQNSAGVTVARGISDRGGD